jgi:tRNA uridine 5-carboxymethylaminomethyl modification enzyme
MAPDKINEFLIERDSSPLMQQVKLIDILARPGIGIRDLLGIAGKEEIRTEEYFMEDLLDSIEIDVKYRGYIERDRSFAEKIKRLDSIKIDTGIDFDSLLSISTEGRQKLKRYMPSTIGQASRISGVSPSDINVLLLFMGR